MGYSASEVVDILLVLGECRGRYHAAARLYRERYPNRVRYPTSMCIWRIERNCRRGRVFNRQRQRVNPGNPRTLSVLAVVHMNPHISLREIERDLGIPRSTAQRILRSNRYHSYHVTLTQALSPQDRQSRIGFCQWGLQILNENPDFFQNVLFSDEATFHSTGALNRHNCHYWSQDNPHWTQQIDHQHRWSVSVWCGMVAGQVIGPYFFEETITGENYLRFLQNDFPVLLENVDLDTRSRMWFQQDGAPAHFARLVRNYLNVLFPRRWIGRSGYISWPPRSPDLTPLDFYLWGYIKDVVYKNRPTTRENLKMRIRDAIANIPPHVHRTVLESFRRRLQLCLDINGGNIEHLI